ncbi:MFS transporter [Acinetobacter sp. CFCC 10889]|uniref:MFS transporter n=1 Tax=Acinetobacter sp. CFCC 10889 TaxID=1775557 RepID=UPI001D18F356|nr:MFS transporter [Acinetobacter sp. CFCC 10889]
MDVINQDHLNRKMTKAEKKIIFASSLGTIFEWYDFYLYGALAIIIAQQFFTDLDATTGFIFALLAFSAGFIVRPFGGLVFGRLGDMVGRKYTFLITIVIMGISTFLVGILPNYNSIGIAAPIILIILRLIQGLALGGEYGGAITYVAEYAPQYRRGAYTAWIQITATTGLLLSLLVILGVRTVVGEEAFSTWGWRIPFLFSFVLLVISIWVRLTMSEPPAFKKLKEAGKLSKAPIREAFGRWGNLKLIILALLGLTMGQGVIWYTGQFYSLYFLTQALKVDNATASILVSYGLLIGLPFFILFGYLSDKIGRKPIIIVGCLLAACTYIPLFQMLTQAANPQLAQALKQSPVVLSVDKSECSFQFDPVGRKSFESSCDIAKKLLATNSVNYTIEELPVGSKAQIKVGSTYIEGFSPKNISEDDILLAGKLLQQNQQQVKQKIFDAQTQQDEKALLIAKNELTEVEAAISVFSQNPKVAASNILDAKFKADVHAALEAAHYPAYAESSQVNKPLIVVILAILVIYVAMVYAPIAAALVEMFATKIRYTSVSLPYHIGNGWFGGLLPTISFAVVAQTGNIYNGLWYPIIVTLLCMVICLFFVKESKNIDIFKDDYK